MMFWTWVLCTHAQNIHLVIVEAQSGDSISNATAVYGKEKVAAIADDSGQLEVKRIEGSTLTVSAVGYKPRKIRIDANTPDSMNVLL